MTDMTSKRPGQRVSNYDLFKLDALKRFLTYDPAPIIARLSLRQDDAFVYVPFCGGTYRISRQEPRMERTYAAACDPNGWQEASCEEVLTICDLLCHSADPISLRGTFTTLESLNRVQSGSARILGDGFYSGTLKAFDGKDEALSAACRLLGGTPMGKGDVSFRIPLFEPIALLFSFYDSDEEFGASLSVCFDSDILHYLHYETLYYAVNHVLKRLTSLMECPA